MNISRQQLDKLVVGTNDVSFVPPDTSPTGTAVLNGPVYVGDTAASPGYEAVLYTPGMSMEVLGEGLKVRNNNDISQLPAKIIKCKKGDIIIEAENGDITLRGRNINIDANGGDQGGQFNMKATRVATIDSPDVRLQAEKILIKADNTTNIISKGFLELKSGFTLSASFADESFGTMSQVLKAATTINPPTI